MNFQLIIIPNSLPNYNLNTFKKLKKDWSNAHTLTNPLRQPQKLTFSYYGKLFAFFIFTKGFNFYTPLVVTLFFSLYWVH